MIANGTTTGSIFGHGRIGAMGGGGGSAHAARGGSGEDKPNLSRWQARVNALFVKAVRESQACEISVRRIARMLDVSPKTVGAWLQDGRDVTVPACRLLELFGRDDILSDQARLSFINGLCAEFGGTFVPTPDVEAQSPDREMRDVMVAVGTAAGQLNGALADGKLSAAERAEVARAARAVAVQAAELEAAALALPKAGAR